RRCLVRGAPAKACPEPAFAAYHAFPNHIPWRERSWEMVSPVLVVEVASDDVAKDFGRNVELYEQVPSIREYWIVFGGETDEQFFFRVYRKRGAKWQKPIDLALG